MLIICRQPQVSLPIIRQSGFRWNWIMDDPLNRSRYELMQDTAGGLDYNVLLRKFHEMAVRRTAYYIFTEMLSTE